MQLMGQHLLFVNFRDAYNFLKKIQIGKVQKKLDTNFNLYIWDSENTSLTEEHKNIIKETDGSNHVWADNDTGLTWLFHNHTMSWEIGISNTTCYGGYDDWRVPTLRELKTLSSNVKNCFGRYVKDGLENKIKGNCKSCTPYDDLPDKAWWDFDNGNSTTEQYSDGKIQWDSEGGYAGFEESKRHNYARLYLVRGVENQFISDWAKSLRDWAESENLFDFPATQKNIEELETLNLKNTRFIPASISCIPKLKHLTCRPIIGIENSLFSINRLVSLKFLRT
jgi:hypothetical protein